MNTEAADLLAEVACVLGEEEPELPQVSPIQNKPRPLAAPSPSSLCPHGVSAAFLWARAKFHSPGINCKARYSYNCRVSIFVQITSLTSFVISFELGSLWTKGEA